jgi:hypothetical protein
MPIGKRSIPNSHIHQSRSKLRGIRPNANEPDDRSDQEERGGQQRSLPGIGRITGREVAAGIDEIVRRKQFLDENGTDPERHDGAVVDVIPQQVFGRKKRNQFGWPADFDQRVDGEDDGNREQYQDLHEVAMLVRR